MAFYNTDMEPISVDEFVKLYSPSYYIGAQKAKGIKHTQSSPYVEREVGKILNTHINSYTDFVRVIAWKIGKIRHTESENVLGCVYASDWSECEKINPMRFNKEMPLKKMAEYILDNRTMLEDKAISDPQECLRLLRNNSISGIGTVYLITILFFLSHGIQPIYDRFAMASLLAYENDLKPDQKDEISVPYLPGKWEKGFATVFDREYGDYIKRLNALDFDYKDDRRLDQALWVYGHAFSVGE